VFVRTRKGWWWFFWLVWRRGDDRRDLCTDFERRRAGMLVFVLGLRLVVSCTGADGCVDGRGVSTAVVVEGIGVGVAGVIVTGGGGGVSGDAGGVEVALLMSRERAAEMRLVASMLPWLLLLLLASLLSKVWAASQVMLLLLL
jgi:hypothetical protein